MVECDLAKVEVAGSNPVSRSNIFFSPGSAGRDAKTRPFVFYGAPSPRGKAEVCKTSTPGSNPGGASNLRSRLRFWRELRLASHAKGAKLSRIMTPAFAACTAITVRRA